MPNQFPVLRYIFLPFLFIILMVSPLRASQGGEGVLSGHIVDQADLAVGGAQITLIGFNSDLVRVVRSGQDGRFEISGLAPDSYEVRVLAQGFAEYIEVVDWGNNQARSLDIGLSSHCSGSFPSGHRSQRRQPHPGAAGQLPFQRSFRRLGVLEPGSDVQHRSH